VESPTYIPLGLSLDVADVINGAATARVGEKKIHLNLFARF